MIDSIYHYDIKITLKSHFRCKNVCHHVRNVVMDVITFLEIL